MINYALESQDLVVVRGGRPVLHDLTFTVAAGTITGLLGPSGCGKTTLLRAAVGTQRIRSGQLTVLGRLAGAAALRREIGYASQGASVYADLTVRENVAYFADVVGAPRSDIDRVLQAVGLDSAADRLTGQLSGGQRGRVSLAVALLGTPGLLVLDEPTVGLDPVLREELWSLFRRLADDGMTLVVSSHVMDEAERCDDVLLLRDGRSLAQDSPTRLQSRTGTETMDAAFLALVREAA